MTCFESSRIRRKRKFLIFEKLKRRRKRLLLIFWRRDFCKIRENPEIGISDFSILFGFGKMHASGKSGFSVFNDSGLFALQAIGKTAEYRFVLQE